MSISSFIKLVKLKIFVSRARTLGLDEICDVLFEEIEKMIEELVRSEMPYEFIAIRHTKDTA